MRIKELENIVATLNVSVHVQCRHGITKCYADYLQGSEGCKCKDSIEMDNFDNKQVRETTFSDLLRVRVSWGIRIIMYALFE